MQPIGGKKAIAICILNILKDYSDFDHPLTQQAIIRILKEEYGIETARNAVSRNISLLLEMGYDISTYSENGKGTYLREREFDDMELRILIDSVLSSKYIPENAAKNLIDKLAGLSSRHFRKRVPHIAMLPEWEHRRSNEFFWNLEVLSAAIEQRKQVTFTYNRMDETGELHPVSNNKRTVHPVALVCTEGQYYLVAVHKIQDELYNYRVDRMTDVEQVDMPSVNIRSVPGYEQGFNVADYAKKHHLMFGGKTERIVLKARIANASEIVDALGMSAKMEKLDEEFMKVTVYSSKAGMLYFALKFGDFCEVLEPAELRKKVKEMLRELCGKYGMNIAP